MNDKKFIELLNLYVDREVTSEDALLLETEVATNADRRRVYDQYCKMQKACSMLSSEVAGSQTDAERQVVIYPSPSIWRSVPLVATLAAAACVAVVVDIRVRSAKASMSMAAAAVQSPLAMNTDVQTTSAAMEPVFLAKLPASQPAQGFTALDTSSQDNQLTWIAGIHMTPVFPSANSDFITNPKSGLKPVGPGDALGAHAVLEPVEMTAFRFQR
jgi:hypothetical protein